ncbi:MAG: sigma-54 interaction domain-containing protein [Arenicella sp.]
MNNSDTMKQMLEAYDVPAILVTANYEILASNSIYREKFGEIQLANQPRCYTVSHGYSKPCDQAGEHCPLLAAKESRHKEKVLHIHQTPNGREHVDVEMIPIFDNNDELAFFVELLRPVPLASGKSSYQQMVGTSTAFEAMLKSITQVGKSDASVLLLGESGTGKELISQSIHLSSPRKDNSMVTLECSGLSEALIESELFGHQKGAFTGANSNKIGLVEQADGGTLFLDEIGDISLETQVKLLRLIESKTFRRVGSTEVRSSDFRLICATHKNLYDMVNQGLFRHDLYFRINVFPIHVPALRERISDIPLLAKHMLQQDSQHMELRITTAALEVLSKHTFKGNIRELRNIISRAIVMAHSNTIDDSLIRQCLAIDKQFQTNLSNSAIAFHKQMTLKDIETNYLLELMNRHNKDKAKVAREANISLRTLYRKLENVT